MERKKIYISILVLILVALIIFGYYYFFVRTKTPDLTTDQGKIELLQDLEASSTNNFSQQQKTDILKKLEADANKKTPEQKKAEEDALKRFMSQMGQ